MVVVIVIVIVIVILVVIIMITVRCGRRWSLAMLQFPASIHICVTMVPPPSVIPLLERESSSLTTYWSESTLSLR